MPDPNTTTTPALDKAAPTPDKGKDAGAPKTVAVKIGDKTFEAPSDLAEALRGYHAAVSASFEELKKGGSKDKGSAGRDRGEDGKFLARDKVDRGDDEPGKKSRGKEPYDYETQLLTNPKEAVAKLREEIMEEIGAKYGADVAAREFWADFYKAEPGLKEHHDFVEAVLRREFKTLGDLPTSKAIGELAKRAKAALAAAAKGAGHKLADADPDADAAADKGNSDTIVEGITLSVDTGPKKKTPADTKVYRSISEQIAARAEARRQARTRSPH